MTFKAMEAFADEQPRPIAEKLYRALSGSRPFARFKAAADVLDLLQDWYDYQNKWYIEKAEEWMRENGVDFEDGKVVCTGSGTLACHFAGQCPGFLCLSSADFRYNSYTYRSTCRGRTRVSGT